MYINLSKCNFRYFTCNLKAVLKIMNSGSECRAKDWKRKIDIETVDFHWRVPV